MKAHSILRFLAPALIADARKNNMCLSVDRIDPNPFPDDTIIIIRRNLNKQSSFKYDSGGLMHHQRSSIRKLFSR